MLGISVSGGGRVHLHLWIIRHHALRNSHIGTRGRILHHHWRAHATLRTSKLRTILIVSHVRWLSASVELGHRLPECKLSMRGHG